MDLEHAPPSHTHTHVLVSAPGSQTNTKYGPHTQRHSDVPHLANRIPAACPAASNQQQACPPPQYTVWTPHLEHLVAPQLDWRSKARQVDQVGGHLHAGARVQELKRFRWEVFYHGVYSFKIMVFYHEVTWIRSVNTCVPGRACPRSQKETNEEIRPAFGGLRFPQTSVAPKAGCHEIHSTPSPSIQRQRAMKSTAPRPRVLRGSVP
eukprot:365650-Chlamydomonas_euryale.AAC.5